MGFLVYGIGTYPHVEVISPEKWSLDVEKMVVSWLFFDTPIPDCRHFVFNTSYEKNY